MAATKILIVITGPTAVGKTTVSLEVAKYFQTEIISADSRQLFTEMNIGTAKPSPEQLEEVKHHFISSHSIATPMNAGIYEREAILLLTAIFENNTFVVVTGGTGLYLNALLFGMDNLPQGDMAWRAERTEDLKKKGLAYFATQLKLMDEKTYHSIDIKNPRRVMRAIEVFELTGKPYSSFLHSKSKERNFVPMLFCLEKQKELLYHHIDSRVDTMIANGLEAEVKSLLPFRNHNALQTVGYKEFFYFFDGHQTYEMTIENIKKNTRNYAKRQLTWFRRYEHMERIPSDAETVGTIIRKIEERI